MCVRARAPRALDKSGPSRVVGGAGGALGQGGLPGGAYHHAAAPPAVHVAAGTTAKSLSPAPVAYEKKLEDLVFEAVRTLKQAATLEGIAVHIETAYDTPPMFRKQLAAHLKSLADAGRLVKNRAAFSLPGKGAGVRCVWP